MIVNNKIIVLFILTLLFLTGCGIKKQEFSGETNNILMVIAPRDFRDEEFNIPKDLFAGKGYNITVGSIQGGEAIGTNGARVNIDLNVGEVNVNKYDAIVFIGGPGMQLILDDESLQMVAQNFNKTGKLVSAICVAPGILAKAGIIENKNATSFIDVRSDIENNGGKYSDGPVVVDGNIITANGPEASQEFGEQIIKYLQK